MTNKELAEKENQLYTKVIALFTENANENLENIFTAYNQIFEAYVNLAKYDVEALKRSLFIHWYSFSEPNYLSGIPQLSEKKEKELLEILEEKIINNELDAESNWMLNYYSNWDYIYERFQEFNAINNFVKNRKHNFFPDKINKMEMESRGQWNSLEHFADN